MQTFPCWLLLLVSWLLVGSGITPTNALQYYCKCVCFGNATIDAMSLDLGCKGCTLDFCHGKPHCSPPLNSTTVALSGGGGSLVDAVQKTLCFARESHKDLIMIVLFLVLTGLLSLYALLRPILEPFLPAKWLGGRYQSVAAEPAIPRPSQEAVPVAPDMPSVNPSRRNSPIYEPSDDQ